MFGQSAKQMVNYVKLKEEDYESSDENLECQVDSLTSELENVEKIRQEEKADMERKLRKSEESLSELERTFTMKCEECSKLQKELNKLEEESRSEIQQLEAKNSELLSEKDLINEEIQSMKEKVMQEARQRRSLEDEILKLRKALSEKSAEQLQKGNSRDTICGENGMISKIFEEVGLSNILDLLKSEDQDVQLHAVKVLANRAAQDTSQEKILEEGGLDTLLSLLETSENVIIHRVTAGAIANLAMNGPSHASIINKGGVRLLANVAAKTDDPQTLRMVAGAIANLCGNEKLHVQLKEDGGIKALLGMVRSGHADVVAQIARGIANFAKCESRAISHGHRKGRSLLIEDGVLKWMVTSSTSFPASTRRHIELALCHLSQNEENTRDIITSGGIKELVRISEESSREDIRIFAKKALNSNPAFLREI